MNQADWSIFCRWFEISSMVEGKFPPTQIYRDLPGKCGLQNVIFTLLDTSGQLAFHIY